MKSETVVDVESVDSDLLYLLLQQIYSQNSGAVFRVSFVFFFVKREEEAFQVKPILVLSPRIFLFDNLIISWRVFMRKYGICYFSCKGNTNFFNFIVIDKPALIPFDLRQNSGAVLFCYDGEEERKSGRIVLLDLIGLVTSIDLIGMFEGLKGMSEFRDCVYCKCD